jgi:hypothetical protein
MKRPFQKNPIVFRHSFMIGADEIVLNRAILSRAQVDRVKSVCKRGKHKRHFWIAEEHFLRFYESPRTYQRGLNGQAVKYWGCTRFAADSHGRSWRFAPLTATGKRT